MLTALLIVITCLLLVIAVAFRGKSAGQPPGPYPWPVLGNLKLLKSLYAKYGGQHLAFSELKKIYKSDIISLYFGTSPVLLISGHDTIRKILQDQVFDARPWNAFAKIRNMGLKKGITFTDGAEWREIRGWLVRCLRSVGFGQIEMSNKITHELQLILEKFHLHDNDCPMEMKPIIAPAVINVIWSLATGSRIENEKRLNYFLDLMDKRAKAFDIAGGMLAIFPWLRYFAPKYTGYDLIVTLNKELKVFLLETIEEHKKHYFKGKEEDLIDMFLAEMYHGKGAEAGFTEDQLLVILIDLFIAGLQTTTYTLDFLFLYMTINQDVQKKLHEELDTMIPHDRLPQLLDRVKLPFTEAVLTESQRLRLVVPVNGPRRALVTTKLNGYIIPKDTCILMNNYGVHTDPDIFEDPHLFKPERHIKDGVFTPDKRMTFFGGGHRRCPGETVAKTSIFLLFTGIMKRYKIIPVPGDAPLNADPEPGILISPKPYRVLLIER